MTTKRTSDSSTADTHSESVRSESTLTLETIRSLAQVMKDFELSELELTQPSGERLRLSGRRIEAVMTAPPVQAASVAAPTPVAVPAAPPVSGKPPAVDKSVTVITAPLVGTFYRSASPESPAFVEVGQRVKKGQTLCIIEAMKLMNDMPSDVSGKIVKVCVDNGTTVEYGQQLFLVDPKG